MKEQIDRIVHEYYWIQDLSCVVTMLTILAEIFPVEIHPQVIEAVFGLNAGRCGLQCGLVQGGLLFIGIYGYESGIAKPEVHKLCQQYVKCFQQEFGSLLCQVLRPQGFRPDNPPHLCEGN